MMTHQKNHDSSGYLHSLPTFGDYGKHVTPGTAMESTPTVRTNSTQRWTPIKVNFDSASNPNGRVGLQSMLWAIHNGWSSVEFEGDAFALTHRCHIIYVTSILFTCNLNAHLVAAQAKFVWQQQRF
ncbi:conserved hypothetical protein [Ricinus communis]|uniref:Uncharacterized protein n=1 Tax=Ricinus communis TaxID=3988 RepID=B9SSC7_RICCO|nr:conserved hypothetical protein [Ricinus communis]